jgi:hypothetical protein
MPYWQAFEGFSAFRPSRHESIQKCAESGVLGWFQQMEHFVDDDVFMILAGKKFYLH